MASSAIASPDDNPITTLPPPVSGFQTICSLAKELADRLAALPEEDRDDDMLKVAEELAKRIRDREEQQIRQDVQDLERVSKRLSRTAPEELKKVLAGVGFQEMDTAGNLDGAKVDGAVRVERGVRGEKGDTGEKGEKGEKGDKGEVGTFRRTYPHYNVMNFSDPEKLSPSQLSDFDSKFLTQVRLWATWDTLKDLYESLKSFLESHGMSYNEYEAFKLCLNQWEPEWSFTVFQKANNLAETPSLLATQVSFYCRFKDPSSTYTFIQNSYRWRTIIHILKYRNLVSKL